ncbi:MAG: dipeptidase, partial [Acidobacteriia bacterium]|nr:dipeptidase [Terriglobia bacterium]
MIAKCSPLLRTDGQRPVTPLTRSNRRNPPTILAALALSLCLAAGAQNAPDAGPKVSAKARRIHDSAIVIDTHADTPQRFLDEGFDIGTVTPVSQGSIDLRKVGAGNLGAEFFSIWVEPGYFDGHYARRAMDLIDSVYEQARRHPERMAMAYSADDIVRARTGPN